MTIQEFIDAEGITFEADLTDANPYMNADDEWNAQANHFTCLLSANGEQMQLFFSQGPANSWPEARDVLQCVADDVASVRSANGFDDWASELGFFPMETSADYKRAKDAWDTIAEQEKDLQRILGDALERLLYEVERA